MRVVYSDEDLRNYILETVEVSEQRPVLIDRFLQNAVEVDVDAVSDGRDVIIAGVMEHIERAGIHSGDSSCCIPPQTLSAAVVDEMKCQARLLAKELKVVGLMNVQFAVSRAGEVYILEVNPRASRTVPFVSKATGVPWAKVAARLMAGKTLGELGVREMEDTPYVSVKACVFPFSRFQGVDTVLGPEMKSTGEVMGIHRQFSAGFAKAQLAASVRLPLGGIAFLSVADGDKEELPAVASRLVKLGFGLVATKGTAQFLRQAGLNVGEVNKVREGSPHIVDMLGRGEIALVINTPEGPGTHLDSRSIRMVSNELFVPTFTTMAAASAAVQAIEALKLRIHRDVLPLQLYHAGTKAVREFNEVCREKRAG